jgi:hypothetical protein
MSAEEKVVVLSNALETIREATFAEFQVEAEDVYHFKARFHVCPVCRRASTAAHLKDKWALIQAEAAGALRVTQDEPEGIRMDGS